MITPRHGFAVAQVGKTIYAVSGVNNAGGAGTLSVVPVNEISTSPDQSAIKTAKALGLDVPPPCLRAPTR